MKLDSMVAEIRYHLNDIEGLGYPDALLKEFIDDGLCMIYTMKPEDFTVRRIKKADEGTVQCIDDCCDKLISVDAQTDACGNYLKGIKKGEIDNARKFGKKSVKLPADKQQFTVYIRDNIKDSFDIYPPVGKDEDVYFLMTCTTPPSIDEDGNIPDCPYHQALLHYVLYRANSVETESQSSISIARQEYAYFYELLGIMRKLDKEVTEDAKSE